MKYQIMSDLHLDHMSSLGRDAWFEKMKQNVVAPRLILAGDICGFTDMRLAYDTYDKIANMYKKVYVVPGNHDHFAFTIGDAEKRMRSVSLSTANKVQFLCSEKPTPKSKVFGGTMWYPEPVTPTETMEFSQFIDPGMIAGGSVDIFSEHQKFMQRYSKARGIDVVVTHHAPHPKSVHPRFAKSTVNAFFVNKYDDDVLFGDDVLNGHPPRFWIHGHCHDAVAYTVNKTEVICNPYGYYHEAGGNGFRWNLAIEV